VLGNKTAISDAVVADFLTLAISSHSRLHVVICFWLLEPSCKILQNK